jgi:hypothetical protein
MTLHPSQLAVLGTGSTSGLKSTGTDSKKSTGTSFSAALKDATSTKAPSGETTQAVEGHNYADILTGPRKGLYLNTGSNQRAGQAFVLVRKNGREYHIYGTGKDRVVIGMKTKPDTPSPAGTTDTGKITTDTSTT